MRRLVAVCVVALATPAMAHAKIYLFPKLNTSAGGYRAQTYKPRAINLPDDLQAVQIRWTGWGGGRAQGVGHVIDEPHNRLWFTATMITSDARAVAKCRVDAGPVVDYYGRLLVRAVSPALEIDDEVSGNFARRPTIQC